MYSLNCVRVLFTVLYRFSYRAERWRPGGLIANQENGDQTIPLPFTTTSFRHLNVLKRDIHESWCSFSTSTPHGSYDQKDPLLCYRHSTGKFTVFVIKNLCMWKFTLQFKGTVAPVLGGLNLMKSNRPDFREVDSLLFFILVVISNVSLNSRCGFAKITFQ